MKPMTSPDPAEGRPRSRPVLNVKEAAKELRLDESTLYRHLRAGRFPGVKVGGRYLVPSAVIDAGLLVAAVLLRKAGPALPGHGAWPQLALAGAGAIAAAVLVGRQAPRGAAANSQPEMCRPAPPPYKVSSTIVALLGRLNPTPAFVLEPSTEVLAWNPAYETLMRPTGLLDLRPPNPLRHTFLVPGSRSFYRDWGLVARAQVAGLRAAIASCAVGGGLEGLVGELSVRSESFVRLWAGHDVGNRRRGVERIAHPVAGEIELAFEVLILADPGERRLITYLPADEASAAALDRLLAADDAADTGAGRLRVVDGGAA